MANGQMSDAELMELVKEGDFSAFDELYKRYREPVYRFLRSLTWDENLADDYLQEVFLRLFRSRRRYSPTGRFQAFIFRIAKNYYLSQRRKMKSHEGEVSLSFERQDGYMPFENLCANERVEPEAHLFQEYRRWRIRRAIDSLPERQKMVFVMSHLQGMKYSEIGELLGVPVGTVKSRMSCAVKALKNMLEGDQDEL